MASTTSTTIGDQPGGIGRWLLVGAGLSLLGIFGGIVWWGSPRDDSGGPVIAVAPETTRFLEPVDADGYLDFTAAINAKLSEGIAPADNAAIPFLAAFGPSHYVELDTVQAIRRELGVSDWDPDATRFQDRDRDCPPVGQAPPADTNALRNEFRGQFREAAHRPWRETEFPRIACLLRSVEPELALMRCGVARSRYYMPVAISRSKHDPGATILVDTFALRWMVQLFQARAMGHLGEDRLEAARDDLLVVHRFARLLWAGGPRRRVTMAVRFEEEAWHAGNGWSLHPQQTPELIASYRDALAALPPPGSLDRGFDIADRGITLDRLQRLARREPVPPHQLQWVQALAPAPNEEVQAVYQEILAWGVDWNRVMEEANRLFDEALAILLYDDWPTFQERRITFAQRQEAVIKEGSLWFGALPGTRADRPARETVLAAAIMQSTLHDAFNLRQDRERCAVRQIAFDAWLAARSYALEHGVYPQSAAGLVPERLSTMPHDRLVDGPLVWRTESGRFQIYSVGINGRDDGGFYADDAEVDVFTAAMHDDLGYGDPPPFKRLMKVQFINQRRKPVGSRVIAFGTRRR